MEIDFTKLPNSRLIDMSRAADEVLEAFRVLGKSGANTVGQVLANNGEFFEMDHYPPGDIYDHETGSQYYYHAHRPESGEHGHFHTFLRADAIPDTIQPYPYTGDGERPLDDEAICHLVAISMDKDGLPTGLFTTNRWVTGETFYAAEDVIALLDRFAIDQANPCLATNNWLTAMVRLFRPQIEMLLRERDLRIEAYQDDHPDGDVFEDEELEVTSEVAIDIDEQIERIDRNLAQRRTIQTSEGLDGTEQMIAAA